MEKIFYILPLVTTRDFYDSKHPDGDFCTDFLQEQLSDRDAKAILAAAGRISDPLAGTYTLDELLAEFNGDINSRFNSDSYVIYEAKGRSKAPVIKARVFFGESLSDAVADGDMKEAKAQFTDGDGTYVERSFVTKAEREAYFQGLADMDGWNGCYPLDDDEKKPSWAKPQK